MTIYPSHDQFGPSNPFEPSVDTASVAACLNEADPEATVTEAATSQFCMALPATDDTEQDAADQQAARTHSENIREHKEKLKQTDEYIVEFIPDPDHTPDIWEKYVGWFGATIMAFMVFIVPGVVTMNIVQTQKIDLVANMPIFGLIFGIPALAGIVASIAIHDSLPNDHTRQRYQWGMMGATVLVFVVFTIIASLAAYPIEVTVPAIEFAQASGDGGWGNKETENTPARYVIKQIAPPMWLLFILTSLLDIIGAPTIHHFAKSRVAPRRVKLTSLDNEYRLIRDELIPSEEALRDAALERLQRRKVKRDRHANALKTFIRHNLAELARLQGMQKTAASAARDKIYNDALKA